MTQNEFSFEAIAGLLGCAWSDHRLQNTLKAAGLQGPLQRSGNYAWIEIPSRGISIMFKEVAPPVMSLNAEDFRLVAVHLHRAGHEGYGQYVGELGGGIRFGDIAEGIESALGSAYELIGGGASAVISGKRIPKMMKYRKGAQFAQYQMDEAGTLEMVTIAVADF